MTTTIAYTDVAGLAGTDLGYTDWVEITSGSTSTPIARKTARSAHPSRTDSSRCRSQ